MVWDKQPPKCLMPKSQKERWRKGVRLYHWRQARIFHCFFIQIDSFTRELLTQFLRNRINFFSLKYLPNKPLMCGVLTLKKELILLFHILNVVFESMEF